MYFDDRKKDTRLNMLEGRRSNDSVSSHLVRVYLSGSLWSVLAECALNTPPFKDPHCKLTIGHIINLVSLKKSQFLLNKLL